jgi:predicted XRE-type DNA-binding protein
MTGAQTGQPRPLEWIGSSKKDLMALPPEVVDVFGYALYLAQTGERHDQAKPLRGFGSAGVLEVVEDWRGNTYRPRGRRSLKMSRTRSKVTRRIEIHEGSGNVYADLAYRNAEEMLVKAKLVRKISEIIRSKGLTQVETAKILGLTQPKVSALLRGQFRGISERKLIDCLTSLGRDVEIVVKDAPRRRDGGKLTVIFA